jgi:kynurenine formamidase
MRPGGPTTPLPRLIDLSHTITHGMTTYPGLPGPIICDYLSREESRSRYAPGVEFQIGKIEMVANTGTYVDSPFHRYPGGKDLSKLPLESLADLESVVVQAPMGLGRSISRRAFEGIELRGRAVLVHTGWDANWGTEHYLYGNPFLTADAAEMLAAAGAALVGIDSLNIDDIGDRARPVHSTLLGAEIPIVEHLRGLDQLPSSGFRFSAVPPRVAGFGTWPVRAYARLE